MTTTVPSFCTNNLVSSHDNYVNFMKIRSDRIAKEGGDPNERVLYDKRGELSQFANVYGLFRNTADRDVSRWHCITLSYKIWCDLVKDYVDPNHSSIRYKQVVNVPEDVLKKFKYRVEQSIKFSRCDYNNKFPKRRTGTNKLNACRYLAMFWTYLDIVKDCKTQRFFPNLDTIVRAAKVFGYSKEENPFEMNGKFEKLANRGSEEKIEEPEASIETTLIEDIGFSTRTYNLLKFRAGCNVFSDIFKKTKHELMSMAGMGRHSITEIVDKLKEYGYEYEDDLHYPSKIVSVMDIAEEAAKGTSSSKTDPADYIYGQSYDDLSEDYKHLLGIEEKYEEALATSKTLTDNYDKLLKEKLECEEVIGRLKSEVDQLHLYLEDGIHEDNFFGLIGGLIKKMEKEHMTEMSVSIGGYHVDIYPDGKKVQ